jgi:hypothetical protein
LLLPEGFQKQERESSGEGTGRSLSPATEEVERKRRKNEQNKVLMKKEVEFLQKI